MRFLVLSGGGSRGSWQAGFLKYLGEILSTGFTFISGTSVGSINAVGLAMYPPEHFSDATIYVHDLWVNHVTRTSDIWQLRKPLGIPSLWNPSVGTNTALEKLLTEVVDVDAVVASGITLRLPAADLETGKLEVFGVGDLARYGIAPVMASASFPIAFPPVEIADWWLTDGGVIDMAPLNEAIEAGAEKILVLATRSPDGVAYKPRKEMKNVIGVSGRVIDVMTQTVLEGDIRVCEAVNEAVEARELIEECIPNVPNGLRDKLQGWIDRNDGSKRKVEVEVIGPSKPLGESLDFSGEMMRAQMDQGYEDAKAAHEAGLLDFLLG